MSSLVLILSLLATSAFAETEIPHLSFDLLSKSDLSSERG